MARLLTVLAFLFAGFFALASTASADSASTSAQQSKRPEGSFTLAQNWNDRVCCKRGNSDWWTTWRQCQRAGGHQTANRECRRDGGIGGLDLDLNFNLWSGGRICCKYGRRDWWTTWGECRRIGGYRTSNRECRDDSWWNDTRICCQYGRDNFWSTQRRCYRYGGYETHRRYCRYNNEAPWGDRDDWRGGDRGDDDGDYDRDRDRDRGDRDDRDDSDDPYNNPDRRVCCKKGYSDWWTTYRECQRAGGSETANRECRND